MKTGHRATPASLYDKLERVVVPLFYHDRERSIPGEKSESLRHPEAPRLSAGAYECLASLYACRAGLGGILRKRLEDGSE